MFLSITDLVSSALASACDQARPLEACGFLLGPPQDSHPIATELLLLRETSQRRGSFSIPDHELRRVAAYAEDHRLRILALFHSHPSGDPTLSPGDRAALRYSAWPWAIVTRSRLTLYAPTLARLCEIQLLA
jgi:proteasome lid subunit RPN8/RPN11